MPYDVVIIGSGPGGYVTAVRAAQLGLKTAIVEKDTRLGGTCLLRGCIPTKSMLHSAELADHARHADTFGVKLGEVSIDIAQVLRQKDKVVQANAGGVAFLMKKNKVDVHSGFGSIAGPNKVKVKAADGTETVLETRYAILATGSAPRVLPGIEIGGPVLTSDELLDLPELPRHLIVLGAGAVGVEFASVYKSFGCDVTVVELADRLVPVEDAEISKEFEKVFRRRGINVHTSTKMVGIEKIDGGVRARLEPASGEGKAQSVSGSHLLVAVGRRPVTEGLNLDGTGVVLDRGFVKADGFGRTGSPWIYAIGDIVAGMPQLAHAAMAEGVVAVEHIAGHPTVPVERDHIPGCTYSSPEVGSVGLTEAEAIKRGYDVQIGRFPFSAIGKAKVVGDTTGFLKLVAEKKYGQILGVHIIGPRATDLIAEALPIVKLEYTLEELTRTVHAHPTLSEIFHEAAHAATGHALHM